MLANKMIASYIKRNLLRAAKLPVVYLLIGCTLIALSFIDNFFPLPNWKNYFELTDKVGEIFIAFSFLTFIYNCIVICCRWYERRCANKHKVTMLLLTNLRKGLRIIFILATINIIITIIGPSTFYLIFANNITNIIIIGSIGWIAIQILYTYEAFVYEYMMSHTNHEHQRAKALYTKTHIMRNIATVVIIVITIAVMLMSFSSVRSIGISLLASAGFLTAIIGLSAQKTLVSLFSGLQIALSQVIKIGDIVVIENNSGIVEEITFTYVTLKLGDRRRLVVPISYLIEKPFENWSREGDSLRSSLHFHVDYMLPITPLRQEFDRILKASPYWDGAANKLQVANLTAQTVEIRIQVSAANADDISDLRAEVREKILDFIRQQYPDYFPKVRLDNDNRPHQDEIQK